MKRKRKISLRNGLLAIIVTCWLVPILIIMSLSGVLLTSSYQQMAQQELETSAQYAMRQVQFQVEEAISDSKGVSYDGVVRSAYRKFMEHPDEAALYRTVNDYLQTKFSRNQKYKATFISFWDEAINVDVYMINSSSTSHTLLQECRRNNETILSQMADADTDIRFLLINGELYLVRNLLDNRFKPYATLAIMLDHTAIFQSLSTMNRVHNVRIGINDLNFGMDKRSLKLIEDPADKPVDISYTRDIGGHRFVFSASLAKYNLWAENPWLWGAVIVISFMVLPLGISVITLFHHHVTEPAEALAKANQRVQSGERGYVITQSPPNVEFKKLYDHFNSMSRELKDQFDRSYLEQQATQKAQIKALQSQINPHFLNNTLEIINWEARIADNQRVSAMIEALSTMLSAALDRNGRTQIPLEEELGYVDAYLYIIQERLGNSFHIYKKIDESALKLSIPRLVLQPIVENAVEHDITSLRGGDLWVRAYQRNQRIVLEVEHDGTLTQEDQDKIKVLLSDTPSGPRVGIQNVSQRLKLIYGKEGEMEIIQTSQNTILARISFPVELSNQFTENTERSMP